jgi:hypothetical protein
MRLFFSQGILGKRTKRRIFLGEGAEAASTAGVFLV